MKAAGLRIKITRAQENKDIQSRPHHSFLMDIYTEDQAVIQLNLLLARSRSSYFSKMSTKVKDAWHAHRQRERGYLLPKIVSSWLTKQNSISEVQGKHTPTSIIGHQQRNSIVRKTNDETDKQSSLPWSLPLALALTNSAHCAKIRPGPKWHDSWNR